MSTTTLEGALWQLSEQIGVPTAELLAYAAEDPHGGVDTGWPGGSIFRAEGQFLYAAVRALKPRRIVEIGTAAGCSTTHLLAALNANGRGELWSYDILETAGHAIPAEVSRERWHFRATDAIYALTVEPVACDMVFEDGLHLLDFTRDVLTAATARLNGLLVSHDVRHFSDYGRWVAQAWDEVVGAYDTCLIAPSDCGLAFAWKP